MARKPKDKKPKPDKAPGPIAQSGGGPTEPPASGGGNQK